MSPTKAPAAQRVAPKAAPQTVAPIVPPEPTEAELAAALEDVETPEEESSEEDDLEFLAESLGIELAWEERPSRAGGGGRKTAPTVPWELILGGLRDAVDSDTRVKIFEGPEDGPAKSRSASMARQIRQRLFSTVPNEEWSVTNRYDPNPTLNPDKTVASGPAWKVYAMFSGYLTDEQTAEKIAKREAIAERLAEGRASAGR